jgi:hypothetical protein
MLVTLSIKARSAAAFSTLCGRTRNRAGPSGIPPPEVPIRTDMMSVSDGPAA